MSGSRDSRIDRVSSVTKAGTSWQVRWHEGGRGRSFTRVDRAAVEARRADLMSKLAGSEDAAPIEIGTYDGTSKWWDETIGIVACRAIEAARSNDDKSQRSFKLLGDTLATLSNAQRPHSKARQTEQLLELLIERMESAGHREAVEHATQQVAHRGIAGTLQSPAADGPDDPLREHGDSVPAGGRTGQGQAN